MKRYGCLKTTGMCEEDDGRWVKYEDHEAELAAKDKEIDTLRRGIKMALEMAEEKDNIIATIHILERALL